MLWDVEIRPAPGRRDAEAERAAELARGLGLPVAPVASARSFLVEGDLDRERVEREVVPLLCDPVVEVAAVKQCNSESRRSRGGGGGEVGGGEEVLNVLFLPGVTDNVARSAWGALERLGVPVANVASVRKYRVPAGAAPEALDRLGRRALANDSIEYVVRGPLTLDTLTLGKPYRFERITVPLRTMDDDAMTRLSREGQLSLSPAEMRTVRDHFADLGRDPTDCELESVAQTWSEHCSHKTLAGPIRYDGPEGRIEFGNMLKETIFAATVAIRADLGEGDWCRSVFADNAGVVHFEGAGAEEQCVCIKVETHNHPSAIEPYGGAKHGARGGDPRSAGHRAGGEAAVQHGRLLLRPADHPGRFAAAGGDPPVEHHGRRGGGRAGLRQPDGHSDGERGSLLRRPLPRQPAGVLRERRPDPRGQGGEKGVARRSDRRIGRGRRGGDGIHGATFSSVDLHEESESVSGGAVQIGDAVTEKMLADVLLAARDRGLYSAVTDCGAGGFSSAVGEMGEETGAEVHLDRAPLKYPGLSPMGDLDQPRPRSGWSSPSRPRRSTSSSRWRRARGVGVAGPRRDSPAPAGSC